MKVEDTRKDGQTLFKQLDEGGCFILELENKNNYILIKTVSGVKIKDYRYNAFDPSNGDFRNVDDNAIVIPLPEAKLITKAGRYGH